MVAVMPASPGASTIEPPSVSGEVLSVLNRASTSERSLSMLTGLGLPPANVTVAASCCTSPVMPSRRTVAFHLSASVPSVIFVKSSSTSDGLPCVAVAKSSVLATPESVPAMLSILSAVSPVGSIINVSCLTCCRMAAVNRWSWSFAMAMSCTAVNSHPGLPLMRASPLLLDDADIVAVVPATVMPSAGL